MAKEITFVNGSYLQALTNHSINVILYNYDYYHLKCMHRLNREIGTELVIAGSSHAMNGVNEDVMEELLGFRPINFSVNSQDLYYDFVNIRHAIKHGKGKIRTAIVNIGYYMIGQDVSLASKVGSEVVPYMYYPLFKEKHNYDKGIAPFDSTEHAPPFDKNEYPPSLVSEMAEALAWRYFGRQKTYYGELLLRKELNAVSKQGVIFGELPHKQRDAIARQRCAAHNKMIGYKHSIKENKELIHSFINEMYEINVKPVFVIFPFTKWYNTYIDHQYREIIFDCLDHQEHPVEFLDMNDYTDMFSDRDYLDSDHLNDEGANKASIFLANYLKEYIL